MNDANGVLWRRLGYMLTPQLQIYKNLAKHCKGKNVLEIGFGTGFGVLQYAGVAGWTVAIEIDEHAVEFAKSALPLPYVIWEQRDIEEAGLLAYPKRYDVAVMIEVIEHLVAWNVALQNIHRMLSDDGIAIISTPNRNGTFLKNDLHGDEWSALQFRDNLLTVFSDVKLYDYSLQNEQPIDTRQTPLVAIAYK